MEQDSLIRARRTLPHTVVAYNFPMLHAVFFDAGNTLVFPNNERTLAPMHERGLHPTRDQLHAAERTAKQKLDAGELRTGMQSVDYNYWHTYYSELLASMNIADGELLTRLIKSSRLSGSWDQVLPGTRGILEQLRASYRLGVISNSDGGISGLLHRCGLAECFESITDSHHVGCEKPDQKIFRAALDELGVAPADSVYVGDVYSVDYLGARSVGMHALLFDVSGTYLSGSMPRIAALRDLPDALSQFQ